MKHIAGVLIFSMCSLFVLGQKISGYSQKDLHFLVETSKWFSAWKLLSTEIYKINKVKPVEFIFFDDKYVYSTSNVTVKNGTTVKGNNLMNLNLKWKRALHNGSIILPDSSNIPVSIISFAATVSGDPNKSFFVMPLPDFWKQNGVTSKELGLDNLITGVFIHEFSHSQQMQNFGKKITEYEQANTFGDSFNDDIVQNIFENDSAYLKLFKREVDLFYNSTWKNKLDTSSVKQGFRYMNERQMQYFTAKFNSLIQIDNFFLTMEGLGQYSMFLWLQHLKGGNIQREIAIEGVRRGRKSWSQDEGFALFLILDKLAKPEHWAEKMFGNDCEDITNLIAKLFLTNTSFK